MKGSCLNWSRTVYHGMGERRGRCRGPGAAGGVHCSTPSRGALAIPGNAGFTARGEEGGHFPARFGSWQNGVPVPSMPDPKQAGLLWVSYMGRLYKSEDWEIICISVCHNRERRVNRGKHLQCVQENPWMAVSPQELQLPLEALQEFSCLVNLGR